MKRLIFVFVAIAVVWAVAAAGSYKWFEADYETPVRGNIVKVIDSSVYMDSVFQDTYYSNKMAVSDPSNIRINVAMSGFTHADSAIDSVGFISVSLFGEIAGEMDVELKNDTFPDAYSATSAAGFDSTDSWDYHLTPDSIPLDSIYFRFIWFDSVMSDTGQETGSDYVDTSSVRLTVEAAAK